LVGSAGHVIGLAEVSAVLPTANACFGINAQHVVAINNSFQISPILCRVGLLTTHPVPPCPNLPNQQELVNQYNRLLHKEAFLLRALTNSTQHHI